MLERRDLSLVDAVARHGSLTRAARELHLTPSALSHQLADLERWLGMALFTRAGRRMVPTPAGERLGDRARELLAGLARAVEDVRSTAERRRDVLRISTECYTCYHWLPRVLREFVREHPHGEVRIVAEATHRPVPALLAGKLDVAVISTPVRDRRMVTTPLFDDEMVAAVAPDHPWARRVCVEPHDFASERIVTVRPPSESTLFREVLDPAGVTPAETLEVRLTEATIEFVKAGFGVAVLARWVVAPHLAAGTLAAVRVGSHGLRRSWSAATLRHRAGAPAVAAFVSALGRWSPRAVGARPPLAVAARKAKARPIAHTAKVAGRR